MARTSEPENNIRRHTRRNSSNDFSPKNNNKYNSRNKKRTPLRSSVENSGPVYLHNEWAFWYDANNAKGLDKEAYENSIIKFGSFKTIQDFWRFYNNIADPQYFPSCSNLRLFKDGIKPLWEDPANVNGGQWTIRTQKSETGKLWIQIVLFIIGEQFSYSDDICGIVLSVRPKSDTINIWNRDCNNSKSINTTLNELRKLLKFDNNRQIVYKKNEGSISMNSSDPNLSPMDNRLTMSASDIRFDSRKNMRTTSLDDLISPSPNQLKFDSEVSDFSDISDISDGEAFELSFDSTSESDEGKSKHRKSSSFSSSPFPSINSPSWKQHRKSNSDSHKKSSTIIPKSQLLQNHRRQNSEDRNSLQRSKFASNLTSLHKELYKNNNQFAPYEIDVSEIKQISDLQKELSSTEPSVSSTKQPLSVFLTWTIGGLFLILIWAVISWQSELFSISI